jgi:uncharacterized protein (UPF0218 family)
MLKMLRVETDFDISCEWEIPSLWMSLESVVGEDATEVRVVGEEDAVHIPNLTLIPIRSAVHFDRRLDGRQLVSVRLHPNPRVVPQ